MLAQRLARHYLTASVEERGDRLVDSPGGNDVSMDTPWDHARHIELPALYFVSDIPLAHKSFLLLPCALHL